MVVQLDDAKLALFRGVFEQPSIPAILNLTPSDAEQFVRYVFEAAGFQVNDVSTKYFPQGPGVDLTLHDPFNPRVIQHGVEVKRWHADVGLDPVAAFGFKLHHLGISGYFVTVSRFTPAAQAVAQGHPEIRLIDGDHLLRYIAYLGRSRVDHAYEHIQLPLAQAAGPEWTLEADKVMQATGLDQERAGIIAIANNKGGVGKSTTARCIALALARQGQRVLLMDMDAQANLTEAVLDLDYASVDDISPNLAGYFAGAYSLGQARLTIPNQANLNIIPGHLDLGMLDTGGAGHPAIELRFARDLYQLAKDHGPQTNKGFAWIILDTPPAISLYTRAALAASDYVLIPARARKSSIRGTIGAIRARQAMNALMGRRKLGAGCVLTHWKDDAPSRPQRDELEIVAGKLGAHFYAAKIPFATAVEASTVPAAVRNAYAELLKEGIPYVGISEG